MDSTDCSLKSVHGRLSEVHKFWHDMLISYQDPENFRINLNAAIQALRNTTFILQSHKSSIPGFDAWYEKKRNIMKEDEVLNWLHQARNIIVKQEDLELYSVATVKVMTWNDIALLEFKVSPFITTEQLTKDITRLQIIKIPEIFIKHGVFNVERRWVVNDLPRHELLEIVSYGYNFINNLVYEAHCFSKLDLEKCRVKYDPKHDNPLIPCMSATRDSRSVNMKLSNQRILPKIEYISEPLAQKDIDRYKNIGPKMPKSVGDIFDFLKIINERAKQMLVLDHCHATMFMFCYQDGSWKIMEVQAQNKSEQFILLRSVADEVKRTSAVGVISISEIWMITKNEQRGEELPAENPNKKEGLNVTAITKDKIISLGTLFERDGNGNIKLGITQEHKIQYYNLMQPIVDALRSVSLKTI